MSIRPLSPKSAEKYYTHFKKNQVEVLFDIDLKYDEGKKFYIANYQDLEKKYNEEKICFLGACKDFVEGFEVKNLELSKILQDEGECKEYYIINSPIRTVYRSERELKRPFLKRLMQLEHLKFILEKIGAKDNFLILPAAYSSSLQSYDFLRDKIIEINEELHCLNHDIKNFLDRGNQDLITDLISVNADVSRLGVDVKSSLPFLMQGGEVVFVNDKKMIFCASQFFLNTGRFNAFALEEDGNKKHFKNEDEFEDFAVKYFKKKHDIDLIYVRRNLESFTIHQLYHLDTFLNSANGKIFAIEKSLEENSFKKLKDNFGENNIFFLPDKSLEFLSTNFINFGNNLVFTRQISNEKILDEVRSCFESAGFSCFFPAIGFGIDEDDGLRCSCQQVSKKTFEKMKEGLLKYDKRCSEEKFSFEQVNPAKGPLLNI
jgi:hypothetical protein